MEPIEDSQTQMIKEYGQLLPLMSDLEKNLSEEDAPLEVMRVFNDLLSSFQQLNYSHEQLMQIFDGNQEMVDLVEDCNDIIQLLSKWFDFQSNNEKRKLLVEHVIPAFESWKYQVEKYISPYVVH